MDRKDLPYWITTGLFCAALGLGGIAHTFRLGPIPESMAALGYPDFVMTIIGVAKILGAIALLAPGRPLLKEWAYAGFTFNLLGATWSHVAAGDPIAESIPPLVLIGLGAASYLLRPGSRRLAESARLGSAAPAAPLRAGSA